MIARNQERFVASVAKLDAMSPLKVLSRGYAMVQGEEGRVLRSVSQTNPGRRIAVRLADGTIHASVTSIEEASHE